MILAADNLHVLNPLVSESLRLLKPGPLQELARRCEAAGALVIDLNPGYLPRRHEDRMAFMVEAVQEVTSLQLMLDSPNPRALAAGLNACRKKPILNALSLEAHKLAEILPLAAEYQTELVLLLTDDRAFTPPEVDEKLSLAVELRTYAMEAGLRHEQLIFDPVLPNLSWQDAFGQVAQTIETIRYLAGRELFGEPARTMIGLSNLRSGLHRKYSYYYEEICMAMLAGAGLQCVLADALNSDFLTSWRCINRMSPPS